MQARGQIRHRPERVAMQGGGEMSTFFLGFVVGGCLGVFAMALAVFCFRDDDWEGSE